jgi:GNAT superfamily N-acetyltransferase
MEITARPARYEDIPAILRFAHENYAFHEIPFDVAVCRSALEELVRGDDWGRALVAWTGDEPIGYAVFAFCFSLEFGGREAFLDEIYVTPGHRERGLGGRFLDLVEAEARSLGLRAIHLEVERGNRRAQQMYASRGYVDRSRFHLLSKTLLGGGGTPPSAGS